MALEWNEAALNQLLAGKDGPVGRLLAKKAARVETRAKQLCAVDTGRLRNSIFFTLDKDGRGLYADIGTNVSYAPYVEFGTRYSREQPFLVPALKAAA